MTHTYNSLFYRKPGKVHVLGICGAGASGISWIFHLRGWHVSGCDTHVHPAMEQFLKRQKIPLYQGHSVDHLTPDTDVVVYSAAIPDNHPELVAARNQGILTVSRGQALAAWVNAIRSVAVCGTHGKTTTSCFTTHLLQLSGLDPLWCLGGKTDHLGTSAGPLLSIKPIPELSPEEASHYLGVAESDESDGSLALEKPAITILTNIDLDHVDHFKSEQDLEDCFQAAISNTREAIAVCAENERAMRVVTTFKGPLLTYGFSMQAVLRATELDCQADSTSFTLSYKTQLLGRITLPVPGQHNVLNALGAFCALILTAKKDDLDTLREWIVLLPQACRELPKRRFQWVLKDSPVQIAIDYAHHHVETAAAMSIAAMQPKKRLRVVFQPHRYSRTKKFMLDFPPSFQDADEVILLPTYAASESFIPGGEAYDLYAACRAYDPKKRILLAQTIEEVYHYLCTSGQAGDLFLFLGAGDINEIHTLIHKNKPQLPLKHVPAFDILKPLLPESILLQERYTLNGHSFYRVGGTCDLYAEIYSVADLCAFKLACYANKLKTRAIGAGANTWYSDLGMADVCYQLKGSAFSTYTREGNRITAGASLSGQALLDKLQVDGLSGLEFMQSVPGLIGGWGSMNAGAFKQDLWAYVEGLEYVDQAGQKLHSPAKDFKVGYRSVHGLKGLSITAISLNLSPGDPNEIAQARKEYKQKRVQIQGMRTCGSVFKNPPTGTTAGIMLDQSGAKEMRIGGAYVTDIHANIIATDPTATASDVLALILSLRSMIQQNYAVTLEPEVRGFKLP